MLKTAIYFIFVLTFSIQSEIAFSNLSSEKWVFHYENKNYNFTRYGKERGHALVSLSEIAKRFNLHLKSNSSKSDFVLKNPKTQKESRFSTRHNTVISFWGKLKLSSPVIKKGGRDLVPIDFGDRVLRPLLNSKEPLTENREKTSKKKFDVVIDPGHGANDFGTRNSQNLLEKDLVLKVSQELYRELEKQGVRVALTREKDSFLTLPERTKFANEVDAQLFLSLHFNYDPFQSVRGFEIFVLSLNTKDHDFRQTIQIENQVIPQEELDSVGRSLSFMRSEANLESSLMWAKGVSGVLKNYLPSIKSGVKMAPFYVLWGAKMPSLLVELGYINSTKDMSFFKNKEQRTQLVSSLADMIAQKIKEGDKNEKKL